MALTKKDLLAIKELIDDSLVKFDEEKILPIRNDVRYIKSDVESIKMGVGFIKKDIEGLGGEIDNVKKHLKLDGPIKPTMRVH